MTIEHESVPNPPIVSPTQFEMMSAPTAVSLRASSTPWTENRYERWRRREAAHCHPTRRVRFRRQSTATTMAHGLTSTGSSPECRERPLEPSCVLVDNALGGGQGV